MQDTDEFVYVNQDGSIRRLAPDERAYLAEQFSPGDGDRPYIKDSYDAQDGWGSRSGFLLRTLVPRGVQIEPVNPDYVAPAIDGTRQFVEDGRRAGDIITENADGSVSVASDPAIPVAGRFERHRQVQLERQREREALARHPDFIDARQSPLRRAVDLRP